MRRVRYLVGGSMVLGIFLLGSSEGVKAQSGSFLTEARVDCTPGTSGNVNIQLFRDGVMIFEEVAQCIDGGATNVEMLTPQAEPNAWQIFGTANGEFNVLCSAEAGTRFPAVWQCSAGRTAVHVIV